MTNNFHSIAYSFDDKIELRPFFKLRFAQLPTPPGSGQCLVDIFIKNNGAIGANYPFLCLTELGLHVVPATGWAQRDIKLVRKMKQFTHVSKEIFVSGADIHCCTIILKYNFNYAGSLEFERGKVHGINSLPDLNLVCVVGAGNYPSKRVLLRVPSSAVKAVIERHGGQMTTNILSQA